MPSWVMVTWPASLEDIRVTALTSVSAARGHIQRAMRSDPVVLAAAASLAGWRFSAACRDCQRLAIHAQQYKPASGRWSSRLLALRRLIEGRAARGVALAGDLQDASGDRRLALLNEANAVAADLEFYLETLVCEWGSGF